MKSSNWTDESDVLAVIHEMAADLHKAGVMNSSTMREFDDLCTGEANATSEA